MKRAILTRLYFSIFLLMLLVVNVNAVQVFKPSPTSWSFFTPPLNPQLGSISFINDSNFSTGYFLNASLDATFTSGLSIRPTGINFSSGVPVNATNISFNIGFNIFLNGGGLYDWVAVGAPDSNMSVQSPTGLRLELEGGGLSSFSTGLRNFSYKVPAGYFQNGASSLFFSGGGGSTFVGANNVVLNITEVWMEYQTDNTPPRVPSINFTTGGTKNSTSPSRTTTFQINNSDDFLLGSCFYSLNGGTNTTYSCSNGVFSTATLTNVPTGNNSLVFYTMNDAGAISLNSTSFNFFMYGMSELSQNFSTPVYESSLNNFTINITYDSTYFTSASAILTYNGTNYTGTQIGTGDNILFRTQVYAPTVNQTTNFSLRWAVTLSNITTSLNFNSLIKNQTVLNSDPINVSVACVEKAITFDFKDEQNFTSQTANIQYYLQYGIGNNTQFTTFGSLTSIQNFSICINSTISNNWTIGYGEIQYQIVNGLYADRRNYLFTGMSISNRTQNTTLYSLLNAQATSFLFESQDSSLTPYNGIYLGLLRWYPALGTYNIVEMAKTDEEGNTIMRVEVEDVDYRVALWEADGTLIKLNEPTRFACLSAPCTYSTTVSESTDFTSFTGIQNNLTYNASTNRFTFLWNDPSMRTTSMNLTVYRETGLNSGVVCSTTGTGFVGAISCDVTGQTGLLRAAVFRSASPALVINELLISLGSAISDFSYEMGLIITAILSIFGFFIGIFFPVVGIILLIASLIPAVVLGSITITILIAIGIMGIVVLHFVSRARGR